MSIVALNIWPNIHTLIKYFIIILNSVIMELWKKGFSLLHFIQFVLSVHVIDILSYSIICNAALQHIWMDRFLNGPCRQNKLGIQLKLLISKSVLGSTDVYCCVTVTKKHKHWKQKLCPTNFVIFCLDDYYLCTKFYSNLHWRHMQTLQNITRSILHSLYGKTLWLLKGKPSK